MSRNITKKIFAIVISMTVMSWIAMPVSADTVSDLQAQIAALLAQISTLQAQLNTLQGGGSTGTTAACTGITFTRNLSQGSTGTDVKCLQSILNQAADTKVAASGAGSPGNESTYFGSLTKAAVVKFQQKYAAEILTPVGLTAGTGFVGAKTIAKLNSILGAGGGGGGVVIPGTGLNVALAADNPGATTIVADTATADGAQSLIPFLKVKFTNGDASEVKVTKIQFTRSGISADADISQAYLYDGATQLAQYNSFSSAVLTFNNASGLFTIPAGGSKTITLKADLTDGTASGKQMRFSVTANTNVSSNASAISGVFPITGNYMVTATASDLGKLTVATTTGPSATIDPQANLDVFSFSLRAQDQKIQVQYLKFTNIGSTAYTDLGNLKLYVNGVQVGSTIATMNTDKTVVFDLSASPITIDKGVTQNASLKADIISGTNRTFQFSFQYMTDIVAYDTQYGVYLKPNQSDSWTVLSMAVSTISAGKLVLSRATDSPSGNIAKDGTNVTIAKFTLKASGEDAKISSLRVLIYGTIGANGLYQGKLILDGSQIGSTANLGSSAAEGAYTSFSSFGNTFVVPADGQTHTLLIKADIKASSSASLSGSETLTAKISTVTATGKTSLQTVSVGDAAAFQLTVQSGALSAAKYGGLNDWSSSLPTAVPGQNEVLVGAFTIKAGASEGADITGITLKYSTTTSYLSNLKIYSGNKTTGTQLGSTQSSVSADTNYTFYPSPYLTLDKSQEVLLSVYADVQTGMGTSYQGYIQLGTITGVGKVTNSSVNWSGTVNGQTLYFSSGTTVTIAGVTSDPLSSQIMMGSTGVTFTKVKFSGAVGEAVSVTKLTVTGTRSASAPTSTLQDISLWDVTGTPVQIGTTIAALNATTSQAIFDISGSPFAVNAGETKTLAVKANINNYALCTSAGGLGMDFATGSIEYKGASSGAVASNTTYITGNVMYTYKTTVAAAKNSGSPSGSAIPSTAQQLLWFDVTNQSGAYSAYFKAATFTLAFTQGTGYATTTTGGAFYLYDLGNLSTPIGLVAVAAGTTVSNASISISASSTLYGTSGFEITPLQTKTFVLTGPTSYFAGATSGSNSGSRLQVNVTAGTNFYWNDGYSSAADVYTTLTKTFPMYGGVLTY